MGAGLRTPKREVASSLRGQALVTREIVAPTLLLVGELDHPDLHERTRFLQEKIAGSKRVVLPDAGHTSNLENPEAFNEAAADFLEESGVCPSR